MAIPPVAIRDADRRDLQAIDAIYDHYVTHSACTYQLQPDGFDARVAWFDAHDTLHPVVVAELDGEIVGWGSLSVFNRRGGYARTVEDSVYVRHDRHRRGVGRALLGHLVDRARDLGHHAILAGIDSDQLGSIALHRAFDFFEVGRLREVGFKQGAWRDVVYLERLVDRL